MSTNMQFINSTKQASLDFCSAALSHKYASGREIFLQAIRASSVRILTEI